MHEELMSVIRDVRRRWRMRLALRGLTWVIAVTAVLLLIASLGMQRLGFTPQSVLLSRVVAYAGILGVATLFLIRPLIRRVSDHRVALYLEEHEPTLDAAVVSAVDQQEARPARATKSEALSEGVVTSAVHRLRAVERGRRIERRELQRSSAILGAVVLAVAAVILTGPDFIRDGARALFTPWGSAEAAVRYTVDVAPGDTTIPRGGDLEVNARLGGFEAEEVTLVATRGTGEPERIVMTSADSAQFSIRLLDLDQQTEYYVEAGSVRSPVFRIAVADLPFVKQIDLEYRYPGYTGLAPQRIEDGGDIAAIRGTRVTVGITSTIATTAGRLVLDGKDTITLAVADSGRLEGELMVSRSGFYKVELADAAGRYVPASLDYAIDMLDDGAPSITITRPGRDSKVSSLEEVFIEARAEDDFGVQRMELVYSVNGGEEKKVSLHDGRGLKDISAGHTLYLEEMTLKPGDLISYFARASDADRSGGKTATTDIYFL